MSSELSCGPSSFKRPPLTEKELLHEATSLGLLGKDSDIDSPRLASEKHRIFKIDLLLFEHSPLDHKKIIRTIVEVFQFQLSWRSVDMNS